MTRVWLATRFPRHSTPRPTRIWRSLDRLSIALLVTGFVSRGGRAAPTPPPTPSSGTLSPTARPLGEPRLATNALAVLDENIPVWKRELHIPHVGIALLERGHVVATKVYGPEGKIAPVDTLFNIASVTKVLVAMTTLKLIEEGDWELDAPLFHDYVDPEVASDPRHERLTTRHVLSHQTGFVNWRWNHPTGRLTFDFEPGEKFQYSGEGMEYLRKSLEARFEQSWSELARDVLFLPLEMNDSRHSWDGKVDRERFAAPFDIRGEPHDVDHSTSDNAADDVVTTVGDLGRFAADVLDGGGLSEELFADMVRAQSEINSNSQQALGWRLVSGLAHDEYAIQHGGNDIGVAALVVLLPESGRGVVVLTNGDNGLYLCNNVVRAALPEGKEIIHRSYRSSDVTELPDVIKVSAETLQQYSGTYEQPSGRVVQIRARDDGVDLEMPGTPILRFYPRSANQFFLYDFDAELEFTKDPAGEIDAALLIEGDNVIRCERKS